MIGRMFTFCPPFEEHHCATFSQKVQSSQTTRCERPKQRSQLICRGIPALPHEQPVSPVPLSTVRMASAPVFHRRNEGPLSASD